MSSIADPIAGSPVAEAKAEAKVAAAAPAITLPATGERELIEDSWRDGFWGWGENRDGKNMLGKLWMEVRAELRVGAAAR